MSQTFAPRIFLFACALFSLFASTVLAAQKPPETARPNHFSGAQARRQHPVYYGFDPLDWSVDMVLLPAADYLLQDQYAVYIPAFRLSRFQVTRQFYHSVMRLPRPDGPYKPVVRLSWFEAVRFANKLSRLAGLRPAYRIWERRSPGAAAPHYEVEWPLDNDGYRLPTEAEWEYAARGGTPLRQFLYSGSNSADNVAWHNGNTRELRAVGQKEANTIGLYDMSGNAWDWLWDRFIPLEHSRLAKLRPIQTPQGLAKTQLVWRGPNIYDGQQAPAASSNASPDKKERRDTRVCRGGAWNSAKDFSEVQRRSPCFAAANYYVSVGFRLARSAAPERPNGR